MLVATCDVRPAVGRPIMAGAIVTIVDPAPDDDGDIKAARGDDGGHLWLKLSQIAGSFKRATD